jgi:3-methyladenine DNA glycosylase AlkD
MPSTALSIEVMRRLGEAFRAEADPDAALDMRAYMRDQFPFLGIKGPRQKQLARQVLAGLPAPTERDLVATARSCWDQPEREYQYFACALLRRYAKVCSAGFLDQARSLILMKAWWDTVDTLAAHLAAALVSRHPSLVLTMDQWSMERDLWLVRAALLHQLTYKRDTDAERLFRYCRAQAEHRDFFIRKAIGWALREYSRTDPVAVRAFVRDNAAVLSPLSIRAALKNIGPS